MQSDAVHCSGDGYESDGDDLTGEMQVQVEKGRVKKHTEQSQVVLYGMYVCMYIYDPRLYNAECEWNVFYNIIFSDIFMLKSGLS